MAPASRSDDLFDEFLRARGHDADEPGWERSYDKLQCPECGGVHDEGATSCSVCDWRPPR